MKETKIGWGSTRITFSKEEFDYIYDIVELPSRRDLVSAFDTVWNWDGLGESLKAHPEHLLRWINKIACAIQVHGRSRICVLNAIFGSPEQSYEIIVTAIPTTS